MQTVNYVGASSVRTISATEFTSVGITQATATWNGANSFQQVVSDSAAVYLIATGEFVLDGGITFAELVDALSVGTLLTALAAPPQVIMPDATSKRRLTPTSLTYVEVGGVGRKLTMAQLATMTRGNDHPIGVTAFPYTVVPDTDMLIVSSAASPGTVTLPNIPDANHPACSTKYVAGAGQATFAAGALALLQTTGTGRNKNRVAYSVVEAIPLFNFSGTTVWTLTGDTATS